ncbi:MAG: hypothetical protein AAFP84_10145 [Actinomycetota bacterium]
MLIPAPDVTDEQLVALEARIQAGLRCRSLDGLRVIGFGEIGVAIGVPDDEPVAVVKRVPAVADRTDLDEWFGYLRR